MAQIRTRKSPARGSAPGRGKGVGRERRDKLASPCSKHNRRGSIEGERGKRVGQRPEVTWGVGRADIGIQGAPYGTKRQGRSA
jgi:hypothetical protein